MGLSTLDDQNCETITKFTFVYLNLPRLIFSTKNPLAKNLTQYRYKIPFAIVSDFNLDSLSLNPDQAFC